MAEVLEIEDLGSVRVLRLNRPDRKNALSGALLVALTAALRDAAHDDTVRAIGLTGKGDAFSSGLDLTDQAQPADDDRAAGDAGPSDDLGPGGIAHLMRVECEKPVIAGVNGVAVGLGLSLAMAADMRIAAPQARFHPGYARVGTSPDGGLTWTLPEAVGYERAMRFLLEQRMVGAEEALAIGLVGEVTAEDGFEPRFVDYCHQMADVAPLAAQQTKRLVGRIGRPSDLGEHLREEIRLALHGLSSDASREAVGSLVSPRREQAGGG